jgi:Ca2+/Na+ antiporter
MELLVMMLGITVFMVLDLDQFNRLFDVVGVIYFLLVVMTFVTFRTRQRWYEEEKEQKIYHYQKTKSFQGLPWQEQFAGTWNKIERKNFYEVFCVFSAVSYLICFSSIS